MLGKTGTARLPVCARLAPLACLALLLVPSTRVFGAELPQTRLGECNQDIAISEVMDATDPSLFHVTLNVANTRSNDQGPGFTDLPVAQRFPLVTFFPSCDSVVPCVAGTGVSFVAGSASSDCSQSLNTPNVLADRVEFSFTPDLVLGPNPGPLTSDRTSCNIGFDVRLNPFPPAPGKTVFLLEATTRGFCLFTVLPPIDAGTSGTDDIMFMPTMGEYALAVLALLLLAGSLVILRRRRQSSPLAT